MEAPELEERKTGHVTETLSSPHSPVFKASFQKRLIETNVRANQGAGANFIWAQLLNHARQNAPEVQTTSVNLAQLYPEATGSHS